WRDAGHSARDRVLQFRRVLQPHLSRERLPVGPPARGRAHGRPGFFDAPRAGQGGRNGRRQARGVPRDPGGGAWPAEVRPRADRTDRAGNRRLAPERAFELGEETLALGAFLAGLGFAELAEQLLLPRRELGRCLDHDLGHEVAPAAPLQHRHARPALAELAARLDPGRNVDAVALAIEPGDLDRPAQRRDGEADRNAREQRRGLPLEHRVRLDVDEDVEIARRRAVGAGFALAVEADARAVVDARGNLDLERLDLVHPALAAALAARLLDDLAAAVTVRAWPLDHEQALLRA